MKLNNLDIVIITSLPVQIMYQVGFIASLLIATAMLIATDGIHRMIFGAKKK